MFVPSCILVNRPTQGLPFCLARLLLCIVALFVFNPHPAEGKPAQAIILEIQGAITPAVSDYLNRGISKAVAIGADLIILRMDTPGGLDRSMRDIIQNILASPIPVVSYVAPEGARAASAGTYILYASHVAAMSPATNLGAATPISIGKLPETSNSSKAGERKEREEKAIHDDSTMERKMISDASAYIQSLAERNGRNADWAVKSVREAVSLTADEALKLNVINIIAENLEDLLDQLDGRQVLLDSGPWTITTGTMTTSVLSPSWRYRLLSVISDPNVAYLLLLLGFFCIIFELINPGVILPGVTGVISLFLAFYAFQILPINYSGLALIIVGLAFLISEVFVPSFGSLGIGGITALVFGSLILIDDEALKISMTAIVGTSITIAILILLLMSRIISIKRKKVRTGEEALIGMIGEAADDFTVQGRIWLIGESWRARSSRPVTKGEKVKVISRDGLELTVESLSPPKRKTGE